MLRGKKILLCLTGSIAAYKSVIFVRLLVKAGAEVKVIMTESATSFVSPLTFATLSGNKVLLNLYDEAGWSNHVMLGRWADLMVVAPASCNTIAKMSAGICDNLLLAVYLSAKCPVFIAPAMDEDMWQHITTRQNIERLKASGHYFFNVNSGELASGLVGEGRMEEPENMVAEIEHFFCRKITMQGKRALVTAGPTQENIDPVRYISNHSSGKMGIAVAEELASRGAEVDLILGPSVLIPSGNIHVKRVTTAAEMFDACMEHFDKYDYVVMAAAVADYEVVNRSEQKIKKNEATLQLELKKTKDILNEAGKRKSAGQTIVGFALESENEKEFALKKLVEKNADFIVLNSIRDSDAGFGKDTNKITIFDKHDNQFDFPVKSKKEVASDIINTITSHENA